MYIYPQASSGKLVFQTGNLILPHPYGGVNKNLLPQKHLTSHP